jgi:hypothetical protein
VLPCRSIVHRARVHAAVDVAPRHVIEPGVRGELEHEIRALVDTVDYLVLHLADHGGVHERPGMHGVDGDAGILELFGQIEREHDEGHLAAAIGEVSGIVPLKLQVGEIERLLAGGRDVDDAGGGRGLDLFEHQSREQEAGKVVHGETQLETISALFARRSVGSGFDAGVVDKNVDVVELGIQIASEPSHVVPAPDLI